MVFCSCFSAPKLEEVEVQAVNDPNKLGAKQQSGASDSVIEGIKQGAGKVAQEAFVQASDLAEAWRNVFARKEKCVRLPSIGVLCLRHDGEGNVSETFPNSFLYTLHQIPLLKLSYEDARAGVPLTTEQRGEIQAAVKELEKRKVVGITGDTGALVAYQDEVRCMTEKPCLLTPLLQAPALATMLPRQQKIMVLTADSNAMSKENLDSILKKYGVSASDSARFQLEGMEQISHFKSSTRSPARPGGKLAYTGTVRVVKSSEADIVQSQLIKLVKEKMAANPDIRCILMETAVLPQHSDALRKMCCVPVFDCITMVDYAHSASSDNPRFGVQFQCPITKKIHAWAPDTTVLPAIGVLRIDYQYPAALGDVAHPNSYNFRTPQETIQELTFEAAQEGGELTESQAKNLDMAIAKLQQDKDLVGLTGDCGFLVHYNDDARARSKVPCFMSALLQTPFLSAWFARNEMVLVLTANDKSLAPQMDKILKKCNIHAQEDRDRFIVAGCQDLPGFEAVALAQAVDVEKVQPHMVKLVQKKMKEYPKIKGVLLECTELPPYADAIRLETGLPVLDAITMIDYFHNAASYSPANGVDVDRLVDGQLGVWAAPSVEQALKEDMERCKACRMAPKPKVQPEPETANVVT